MNTHLFMTEGMNLMSKLSRWLDEFFFGPDERYAWDPKKVVSMADYNAEILKQKKTHYPQNSESKVLQKISTQIITHKDRGDFNEN